MNCIIILEKPGNKDNKKSIVIGRFGFIGFIDS